MVGDLYAKTLCSPQVINEMMKLELVDDLPAEQQPIHTTRVPVEEQVLTRERLLDAAEKPSQNETSAAFNREMFRFMPRLRLILEKVCNDYLDKVGLWALCGGVVWWIVGRYCAEWVMYILLTLIILPTRCPPHILFL